MKRAANIDKFSIIIMAMRVLPNDGRLHREYSALRKAGHTVTFMDWADPPPAQAGPVPVQHVRWRWRRTIYLASLFVGLVLSVAAYAWLAATAPLVAFGLVSVAALAAFSVVRRRPWLQHQPLSTLSRWLTAAAQAAAMGQAARTMRPDVVVVSEPELLRTAVAIKAQVGAAVVCDAHEFFDDEEGGNAARAAWVFATQSRYAREMSAFITVNPLIAQAYSERYPGFPTPIVVTNAVDGVALPAYDGRLHAAAKAAPDQPILLFHGGFNPDRGLEGLVAAADLLNEPWLVVLMGDGRIRSALESAAGPRVRFVPPVPNLDLPLWVQGASLGAIPYEGRSLNHIYCSPNKLWEYPAAGVPILARNLPFLHSVVAEEAIGWTFAAEGGPEAIAAVVNAITPSALSQAAARARAFGSRGEGGRQMALFVEAVARAARDRQQSLRDQPPG
jgi:glycosyltransferase involved in cell wall biosynthesis